MRLTNKTPTCPYNEAVDCSYYENYKNRLSEVDKCARCGWNPEVAEARIQAILNPNKTDGNGNK